MVCVNENGAVEKGLSGRCGRPIAVHRAKTLSDINQLQAGLGLEMIIITIIMKTVIARRRGKSHRTKPDGGVSCGDGGGGIDTTKLTYDIDALQLLLLLNIFTILYYYTMTV